MSSEPTPWPDTGRPVYPSRPWFRVSAVWAGLSIVTMWLAVLFVGVFGGNIVSSTPGGTSTSVPVVVAVIPFVLVATVVVARRGFRELPEEPDPTASPSRSPDRPRSPSPNPGRLGRRPRAPRVET